MRLANSYFVVTALASHWALTGCSTSSPTPESGGTGGAANPDASAEQTPTGNFTVSLVPAGNGTNGNGNLPALTDIGGQVYDGPVPEPFINTLLAAPPDATPGCAVYSESPPSCANIGECGTGSSNAACAAAAPTGIRTCVCVATDKCQAYPIAKNAGTVTISGIATTSGATTLQLVNVSNSYQLPGTTTLLYPGFAEGDTLSLSATGGDYPPFQMSAKGIAPLTLTNGPPFNLAKDNSSTDPTQYQPFTITWTPPGSAGDAGVKSEAVIHVEINISHHGGSVGHLACDVDDTGTLTISAGLISQLVALGTTAGNPELTVTRSTSGSAEIAHGSVNLVIESSIIGPTLTMDGYTSCVFATDCPSGQVCNTATKLCVPS